MSPPIAEELTRSVIGAFYDVYGALGHGHMERDLRVRGHHVPRQ